ncbi:type 1 glutamine amidotransferase [Parabacteroides sp. PF5-5]|uniref:ThuA domain-containing protein n=1 Tax=unclassified Parabacteroides TaxID=2649774 RepID=UPI002475919D|nr:MULTISPECIES: ThuA domain-containing protein [unclassified Parabacteroides]MDH6303865.1 type 1 glutamine amidotransferase [Parabacteroides sp. PH5-39]MDH6314482.1 type 1 glutamine amidotransferase [Parabacteroides sp. PF5-13]MDH6318453.1 type 1 glutamine amidotransferase [Parabacteroides sp. PH5-13]MDH6322254.1 type 1 glutamine amidotransferase [Parabacteroides sp. PH5-8]MDH6325666.1 type 1 glutamine amidotransferase [Parabacteroides sp. PH5-41]
MKTLFSGKSVFMFMFSILMACTVSARKPIKTLLITGQNNHNWQVSHIVLKDILENSRMFKVDLAVSPEKGQDMSNFILDFKPYSLVVLDYNGDSWPEETKNAFVEYAQNGGGIIVYHAADNAFPNWYEFNKIIALGGWEGRNENSGPYAYWHEGELIKDTSPGNGGSHGRQHEYMLTARDSEHPITNGLPNRWAHAQDELYDRMRGPANIANLLFTSYSDKETGGSGREEPMIFTVDYGKARIFHTMLGHCGPTYDNNPAMQCTGFQVTLLRGAEWAATGKVKQKVPKDFPTSSYLTYRYDYKAP